MLGDESWKSTDSVFENEEEAIEEKLCNINGTGEKSVFQKVWKRN